MSDEFSGMTRDDLARGIDAYFRSEGQTSAAQAVPLPPAANRETLNPEQQEGLFQNWVSYIYARPSNTWTEEEKAVIRVAISRAL
jgi:hypothetical protein